MSLPPETILAWDAAHAGIALTGARAAELAAELVQLASAIGQARPGLAFEAEPEDFRAALLDLRVAEA